VSVTVGSVRAVTVVVSLPVDGAGTAPLAERVREPPTGFEGERFDGAIVRDEDDGRLVEPGVVPHYLHGPG
jgi:hypothetical protein